jgi:thioredoxin reductase (NADPH)
MEEATFLTRFAEKVYVIHRKDSLRASKIMQERAFENPRIEFVWNAQVVDITGDEKVDGVVLEDTVTGEQRPLALDGLFIAIGNDPRVHLFHQQLDLTIEGTIAVEGRSSRTNLPGVFAAGDVIDPTYRQAITAAASGTVAALDAEHFLASLPDTLLDAASDGPDGAAAHGAPAAGSAVDPDGELVGAEQR